MATARKRKPQPADDRPDPGEKQRAAIDAARARYDAAANPVSVAWDPAGGFKSRHSDDTGHLLRLMAVLGTRSVDGYLTTMSDLDYVSRGRGQKRGETTGRMNAALAMVEAIAPRDELEAALAVQMAGCHALTMEMLGQARQAENLEYLGASGGLAVKLARTFTLQIEALAKLRGGGQQKVEVRHVHVNGNAIVGDVHAPGGGAATENLDQPHTQRLGYSPGAPVPSLWGQDAQGDALPVAGSVGAETVPDARGNVARGREGEG